MWLSLVERCVRDGRNEKKTRVSFSTVLHRRHPLVPSRTATAEARCQGVRSRRLLRSSSCKLFNFIFYRDVAQFGRALRSGRRSRRFESCHLDQKKKAQPGLFSFACNYWREPAFSAFRCKALCAAFGMEEPRKSHVMAFSTVLYRRHQLVPSRMAPAEARCQGVVAGSNPVISTK